jgi:hypothetical protein
MNYEPEIDTIIELRSWEYVLPDPAEELMQKDLVRVVQRCLDGLTPRESKVIAMRFGIDRDRDYTFEQIGKMFGVTRERIRQIEAKALRKLRKPAFVAILNGEEKKTQTQINKDIERVNKEKKEREENKKRIQSQRPREWVRSWDRKDPDEMVQTKTTPNGWIDGSRFRPMLPGIYVRVHKGFEAFSKWDGKNWLQGAKDLNVANKIPNDKISSYQLIQWRKVKHNEQL